MENNLNQTITVSDGRVVGYRCLGDPDGKPLFFFHGTPGSRFCLTESDPIGNIPGLRWILPERPGYGLSSEHSERSIASWANDVVDLADALGIETFSVSGSSGGGPYALACGAALPERVKQILLFNTAAPLDNPNASEGMSFGNRIGIWTARYSPWLLRFLITLTANSMIKNPDVNLNSLKKQLCEADAHWMEKPGFRQAVVKDMQEAYSTGVAGHFTDAVLLHKEWLVDLTLIQQPVFIWHGEDDTLSPVQNVRHMAQRIPNCQAKFISEAGHFLVDLPEVVEDLKTMLPNL